MTYRQKQDFLSQYINCQRRIKRLQIEYEEWLTTATNITQKISPVIVATNDNNSKVEMCAIKIAEILDAIETEITTATQCREVVSAEIGKIKDSRRREVLEMRYIADIPVRKIAIILDKDTDNVYKMMRTAIKNL